MPRCAVDPRRRSGTFDLKTKRNLEIGARNIFKSKVFPGLWIDRTALLKRDYKKSMAVLNAGMQSQEYRQFAASLRKRARE